MEGRFKVYLPIHEWVTFDGKLVGKYTTPMDPMGFWLMPLV